jgi:hypothetical protein
MIRVLSDNNGFGKRHPVQILDLQGLTIEEAKEQLEGLHRDSFGHPKWDTDKKNLSELGLRIVIDWIGDGDGQGYKTRHPLEDPADYAYALHPKYGFEPLWFCTVRERGMMYVVKPMKKPKQGLLRLASS